MCIHHTYVHMHTYNINRDINKLIWKKRNGYKELWNFSIFTVFPNLKVSLPVSWILTKCTRLLGPMERTLLPNDKRQHKNVLCSHQDPLVFQVPQKNVKWPRGVSWSLQFAPQLGKSVFREPESFVLCIKQIWMTLPCRETLSWLFWLFKKLPLALKRDAVFVNIRQLSACQTAL